MVDLIPYSSKIAPGGKLTWPKSDMTINVVGFDEACAAARAAARSKGAKVPVITAAGHMLLKIIAFLDRKEQEHPKYRDDARDIEYWLRHYASGEDDPRRFELAGHEQLKHEEYDTAGAVLIGIEVGKLASPQAGACVDRFLKGSMDLYSPFQDAFAAGLPFEEDAEKKRGEGQALLRAFKKGYEHGRR